MLVMPLATSPGDQAGLSAMRNYTKSLERALEAMTPWEQGSERQGLVSDEMRKKIGSGNVAVMFDPGDNTDLDLWQDATVVKK